MAPKIRVPADFGREHINSEVHGNLILKLKDGRQIRTNSMIMSMNSPVIDNLTTNMFQSTLEVDDFENEAVDCFVDSMYTGEVEKLERSIFEEVNKMAHAFEVSWLGKKCLKFYQTDILNFDKKTYDDILFACEIASRAHTNLKQSKFVSFFVKTAFSWNISKGIFLQRYMADFVNISKRQMDMSLAIARDDINLVIRILNFYLSITLKSRNVDENSLYLLEKLDVRKCISKYPSDFEELVYFITEISEVTNNDGMKPILAKFNRIKASSDDEVDSSDDSQDEISSLESDDSESDKINKPKDQSLKNPETFDLDRTGWRLVEFDLKKETRFVLPRQEIMVVEMVTTKNDVEKHIALIYEFTGFQLSLFIRCDDVSSHKWSYALQKCTDFVFKSTILEERAEE
ncbi:uncharacterized protein LOC134811689 [Bolinopsis microptera]|uniref:uncharacterized protein LOC134811689 n=1 Tax=Bolinopsis microptera TaxID=2820187 RepID=UPI00307A10D5